MQIKQTSVSFYALKWNCMINVCMILLLIFSLIIEVLNSIENSGSYVLVYLDGLQSRMILKWCGEDPCDLLSKQL